jgi:hypothetical protein
VSFLYHAISLSSDYMVLSDENNPVHEDLFGIRAVLAPATVQVPAYFKKRSVHGRFAVYEVSPEGYFSLVDIGASYNGPPATWLEPVSRWLQSWMMRGGEVIAVNSGAFPGVPVIGRWQKLPDPDLRFMQPRGHILAESKVGETYRATIDVSGRPLRPAWSSCPRWPGRSRWSGRPGWPGCATWFGWGRRPWSSLYRIERFIRMACSTEVCWIGRRKDMQSAASFIHAFVNYGLGRRARFGGNEHSHHHRQCDDRHCEALEAATRLIWVHMPSNHEDRVVPSVHIVKLTLLYQFQSYTMLNLLYLT